MLLTERQPFWHHPRVSEARCVPQLFTPAVVALAGAAAHRRSAVLRPSAAVLPMAVGARWRVAESRCAPGCLSSRCKNPFCHCRHAKCENDWSPPMGILAALGPTYWETDFAFFANLGTYSKGVGRLCRIVLSGFGGFVGSASIDCMASSAVVMGYVLRLVVKVGLGTLQATRLWDTRRTSTSILYHQRTRPTSLPHFRAAVRSHRSLERAVS